jgi:hypothetical protein
MQAIGISTTPSGVGKQGMPDPVRRPPGRPPQEPIIIIIIKVPPRPPEVPEIDMPDGEEDDVEIRRPPEIVPELPPPARPKERELRSTNAHHRRRLTMRRADR